jgi:hypothetical protein
MRKIIPFLLLIALAFSACTSIDCPLNNRVYCKFKLAGTVTTLSDTLNISTDRSDGNDTVLINRDVNVDSFSLPMSYNHAEDVFFVERRDTSGKSTIDTVTIAKDNLPHFESVDCSPAVFHILKSVTYTKHDIDSIVIKNKNVTYDAAKAHFYIYFKHTGK